MPEAANISRGAGDNTVGCFGGIPICPLSTECARKVVDAVAQVDRIDLLPFTVMKTSADSFDADELHTTLTQGRNPDDVFTPAFLNIVYLQFSERGT